MGKLKEKLLNNLSEEQMEDMFGISAFEYVELMSKYKDDESYPITEAEVEDIEKMVEEYYESKEFKEYLDTINLDEVFAEHNQSELDELNDSMTLKYTDNDILYVLGQVGLDGHGPDILGKLNDIWNTKRGLF
jgi:hypothetical protein